MDSASDIHIGFSDNYDEDFKNGVLDALELLPENFRQQLNNVSIVIEDDQPRNMAGFVLGLYRGVPKPYKGPHYSFIMPDKISLYKHNILRIAHDRNLELKKVIADVLYHEIGHYFGLSEDELDLFRTF